MFKYQFFKRLLDLILSWLIIGMLWPVFILIALSIALTSRGGIIFKHSRVGQNGKIFTLYKFRTLSVKMPAYALKLRDDDRRINKVGRFLRKSSLDELLQLFNVLKGSMSLVGPRPEMPFIVENYTKIEKERLKVKPGITGLWQISGKTKEPIHNNLEYDLSYIKNQSLVLDLKILMKTLVIALKMFYFACQEFFKVKIIYYMAFLFLLWFCHLLNNYIWLRLDTSYCTYDAHRYFMASLKAFQVYQNLSFHCLSDFIKINHFQPPLVGLLIAPFYFIFGISQDTSVMLNGAIFLAILILSIYKIGEKLLNKPAGLLAAFLMTIYPVVFNQLKVYMLDLPLAAFVSLSICLLILARSFQDFKYSLLFGTVCGLGMLIKPAFGLFIIGPLVAVIISNIFSLRRLHGNIANKWIIHLTSGLIVGFFVCFFYYLKEFNVIQLKASFRLLDTWSVPLPESSQLLHIFRSLLWYLWGLINWQISFFFFSLFIAACFYYFRTAANNKNLIVVWLLSSWILISYFRLAIGFNMEVTGVRYTLPLLPAVALITAVGIMQIPIKKIKVFLIVAAILFGIIQLFFVSYPIGANIFSQEVAMAIDLPGQLNRYKLFPEKLIIFSFRPLIVSGSDHDSFPQRTNAYLLANEEIFKVIDATRNSEKGSKVCIIPDNAQLWFLQYQAYLKRKPLQFICDWNDMWQENRWHTADEEEKIIHNWVDTSDYIMDKDDGFLGEDNVLGDIVKFREYFKRNQDEFTLLSKIKWPDGSNVLIFKKNKYPPLSQ